MEKTAKENKIHIRGKKSTVVPKDKLRKSKCFSVQVVPLIKCHHCTLMYSRDH